MGPNDNPLVVAATVVDNAKVPLVTRPPLGPLQNLQNIATGTYFEGGNLRATPAFAIWLAPQPVGLVPPGWYGLSDDWSGFSYGALLSTVEAGTHDYLSAFDKFFARIDNRNPARVASSLRDALGPFEAATARNTARAIGFFVPIAKAATDAGNAIGDTAVSAVQGVGNAAFFALEQVGHLGERITFSYDAEQERRRPGANVLAVLLSAADVGETLRAASSQTAEQPNLNTAASAADTVAGQYALGAFENGRFALTLIQQSIQAADRDAC